MTGMFCTTEYRLPVVFQYERILGESFFMMCVSRVIVFVLMNVLLISCGSIRKSELGKPQSLANGLEFDFQYKAEAKKKERHHMYIAAHTKEYIKHQIRTETDTVTEVDYEIDHLSSYKGFNYFKLSVVDKEGYLPLSSFGFPEYQQSFNFVTDSKGKRLKVGNYVSSSFYFVPSVFLPKRKVKVGDTWESEFQWKLNGELRKLGITSIFKRAFACGPWQCADIELSGNIYMGEEELRAKQAANDVVARYIIQIHSGTILWSSSLSRDRSGTATGHRENYLCSVTRLEAPGSDIWPWAESPHCEALKEFENEIPGL